MRHLFFLFILCFCSLSAEVTEKKVHPPKKKYALYLTTGKKAHKSPDVEWGGCHVTLAGFHEKHGSETLLNKIPQIIKDNSKAPETWRPKHLKVQKWRKHWAVVFHSHTLNKIARQLTKEGFKNVKGSEFSKSPFHMVLPHLKDRQAAESFATELKDKKWYVTVVELEPSDSPFLQTSWLRYFHL